MSAQVLHRALDISHPILISLKEFARRSGLTFPQVITLATIILIHRLTGTEDLVVGQFMTARMSPIARATPSMATNLVPLRFSIQSDMPVGALAEQVRKRTREALRRQRYRIADIRRDLHCVDRPIARQVCSVRPLPRSPRFADARTTNHPLRNGPVEDVNIYVVYDESGDGACRLEFDANHDLYTAEELERLQRRYLQVLSGLNDVHEFVGRLEILPPEERRLILYDVNRTAADYPQNCTINKLFQAQAQRTPNRVAATFGNHSLTYRELDEQTDLLAIHLSGLGVGPSERVALHVERSLDMLVALLGNPQGWSKLRPTRPQLSQREPGICLRR